MSVPGLFSPVTNRQYVRKFDHDEARRRYAAGETMASLAREYGCSYGWMRAVIRPEVGKKLAAKALAYIKTGVCVDCGAQISIYQQRCVPCSGIASRTTVRDSELRCSICHEWKPDAAYPKNRAKQCKHRRGYHRTCTACQTRLRRDYRHRHREQQNAYDREYKRRTRSQA